METSKLNPDGQNAWEGDVTTGESKISIAGNESVEQKISNRTHVPPTAAIFFVLALGAFLISHSAMVLTLASKAEGSIITWGWIFMPLWVGDGLVSRKLWRQFSTTVPFLLDFFLPQAQAPYTYSTDVFLPCLKLQCDQIGRAFRMRFCSFGLLFCKSANDEAFQRLQFK